MANKHQEYDLAQMQSLPLEMKVLMTKNRIRQWYNEFNGDVYVSISGGKDSQVLAHIVKEMYSDVPLVFVNTGLEWDSVREKGYELADEVLRPEIDFVNIIKKYGYPIISKEVAVAISECQRAKRKGKEMPEYRIEKLEGRKMNAYGTKSQFNMEKYKFLLDAPFRISNKCCDYSKKNPSKKYEKLTNRKPFIGTMAEESRLRRTKWMRAGCNNYNEKRPTSQPLSFWTEQDILKYIKLNNLKIADIYGDIVYTDKDGFIYDNNFFNLYMKLQTTKASRTGCVWCLFAITQDRDKLIRLKENEPKKYDYVMRGGKFDDEGMWVPDNGLGYKFVIDWINEHSNLNIKY